MCGHYQPVHEIENHCTSVMLVELIKGVKQPLQQEKC